MVPDLLALRAWEKGIYALVAATSTVLGKLDTSAKATEYLIVGDSVQFHSNLGHVDDRGDQRFRQGQEMGREAVQIYLP
jgi:hypothetical protein